MRHQLLVDGESVDSLVEIFPYFDTHREPNGLTKVTAARSRLRSWLRSCAP